METLAELVRVRLGDRKLTQMNRISDRTPVLHTEVIYPTQLDEWGRPREAQRRGGVGTTVLVGTATLELAPVPLHEQIYQFATTALTIGCDRIQILPLFLLPGVHVMEDIPHEVRLAQHHLGERVVIEQRPYLGAHPNLGQLLLNQRATIGADATILLSHGTRRSGGNQFVENVAEELGAIVAYWSVQPTLLEQVKGLVVEGYEQITIVPYFLFSGGITDAIAQLVAHLGEQFSTVQLNLGEPIGATVELANLIIDLIEVTQG